MNKPTPQPRIILTALIFCLLGIPAFAGNSAPDSSGNCGNISSKNIPEKKKEKAVIKDSDMTTLDSSVVPLSRKEEKELTQLQKQARLYRAQGVQFQKMGNLESAMALYQKAIQLDPAYAIAYNDLGVVLEAEGLIDRAQQCYLMAVKIDPNFASAYTNLALLYENERELDKAAFCWGKRAELGAPGDPWTVRANQRLEDIRAITSNKPLPSPLIREQKLQQMREQQMREMHKQEVTDLAKDVSAYKDRLREDNKVLAASYMKKAKRLEKQGDEITALKIAIDAQQLDPDNEKIENYINKLQIRNLSK